MKKSVPSLLTVAALILSMLCLCSCGAGSQGETAVNTTAAAAETAASGKAEITFESRQQTVMADDGTAVYTGSVNYPVVACASNPAAEKAINSAIQSEVNKVLNPEYDYKGEYGEYKADGLDYYSGASVTVNMDVTRNDDEYLSFRTWSYVHGACSASDSEGCSGVTFDAKTGALLSLGDIFTNADSLHSALIAGVQAQIAERSGSGELSGAKPDTAAQLIAEDAFGWCLTGDKLLVFFSAGEIAPMLFGSLEFEISLEALLN